MRTVEIIRPDYIDETTSCKGFIIKFLLLRYQLNHHENFQPQPQPFPPDLARFRTQVFFDELQVLRAFEITWMVGFGDR
jgi:hypothetical protein